MKTLYGKLEKEKLIFAPNFITLEKFKKVVFTKSPEDTKDESIIIEKWQETKDEIIQIWEVVPVDEKE